MSRAMSRPWFFFAAVGLGLTVGCSDSNTSQDAAVPDLAVDQRVVDLAPPDSNADQSPADSISDTVPADLSTKLLPNFGQVALRAWKNSAGGAGYDGRAWFQKEAIYKEVGPCRLLSGVPGGSGAADRPSAGVITVTGGKQTVTLTPKGLEPGYGTTMGSTSLWDGGETLTYAAVGDAAGLPAFNGSVAAPKSSTPTGYDGKAWPSSLASVVIDKTSAHTFSWSTTGLAAGAEVEIKLSWSAPAPGDAGLSQSREIRCYFDATKGSAVVPKAILELVEADKGDIDFAVVRRLEVSAGTFSVELLARSEELGQGRELRLDGVTPQLDAGGPPTTALGQPCSTSVGGQACPATDAQGVALVCLEGAMGSPPNKGFCTRICTGGGGQCDSVPSPLKASCSFATGGKMYCMFYCKSSGGVHPCPTGMTCGSLEGLCAP